MINCKYTQAFDFKNGVAKVSNGKYFGLINACGDELTDFVYSEIDNFQNSYAIAKRGSFYGVIMSNGDVHIDFVHNRILSFDYVNGRIM